jgi:hypothetical protein
LPKEITHKEIVEEVSSLISAGLARVGRKRYIIAYMNKSQLQFKKLLYRSVPSTTEGELKSGPTLDSPPHFVRRLRGCETLEREILSVPFFTQEKVRQIPESGTAAWCDPGTS